MNARAAAIRIVGKHEPVTPERRTQREARYAEVEAAIQVVVDDAVKDLRDENARLKGTSIAFAPKHVSCKNCGSEDIVAACLRCMSKQTSLSNPMDGLREENAKLRKDVDDAISMRPSIITLQALQDSKEQLKAKVERLEEQLAKAIAQDYCTTCGEALDGYNPELTPAEHAACDKCGSRPIMPRLIATDDHGQTFEYCDPDDVAALEAEVKRLEAEVATLREDAERLIAVMQDAHGALWGEGNLYTADRVDASVKAYREKHPPRDIIETLADEDLSSEGL